MSLETSDASYERGRSKSSLSVVDVAFDARTGVSSALPGTDRLKQASIRSDHLLFLSSDQAPVLSRPSASSAIQAATATDNANGTRYSFNNGEAIQTFKPQILMIGPDGARYTGARRDGFDDSISKISAFTNNPDGSLDYTDHTSFGMPIKVHEVVAPDGTVRRQLANSQGHPVGTITDQRIPFDPQGFKRTTEIRGQTVVTTAHGNGSVDVSQENADIHVSAGEHPQVTILTQANGQRDGGMIVVNGDKMTVTYPDGTTREMPVNPKMTPENFRSLKVDWPSDSSKPPSLATE